MPRQLKEIKNFNFGTVLNASERDIPEDASAFALNIDALSEDGILRGIQNDAFFMSSNLLTSTVSRGIRWAPYHISDATKKGESFHVERSLKTGNADYTNTGTNNDDVCIDDISVFDNKGMCKIGYIGTKGVRETVIADKIQPYYEVLLNSTDMFATGLHFDGTDADSNSESTVDIQRGTGGASPAAYGLNNLLFRKLFKSDGTELGTPHEIVDTNTIDWICTSAVADEDQIHVQSVATHNPAATISGTDTTIPYRTKVVTVDDTTPTGTCYVARSGGVGDSQFTTNYISEGVFSLVFLSATASDYDNGDNDFLTICGPDGYTVKYEIDDDVSTTGAISGHTPELVDIGLSGVSGIANIAAQFKEAIEHINGHLGRVSIVTSTTSVTNDTLTITFTGDTLGEMLTAGDYFSLTGSNTSNLSGEYDIDNDEIIYVESVDTTNNELKVKRGVFGRAVKDYIPITSYNRRNYIIYANRMTITGEGFTGHQVTTSKCSARFTNFSNRSGNHIGWSAKSYSHASSSQLNPNGRFYTSSEAVGIVLDATAKTLTTGATIKTLSATYGNFNIEEGDWVYYIALQDPTSDATIPAANNGFHAKVLKKEVVDGKIVLTFDKAPISGTHSSGNVQIFLDTSIVINGSFYFARPTANSSGDSNDDVGDDKEYKANEWKHVEYVESSSGWVQNKFGYDSSLTDDTNVDRDNDDVNNNRSDKRWFSVKTHGDQFHWPYYPQSIKLVGEYNNVGASSTSYETKLQVALIADSSDTVLNLKKPVESVLAVNDIILYDSEYMKVNTINGNQITVTRGYLESTIATHSIDTQCKKCCNAAIQQTIPKYKLKPGQSYRLIWYAKSDDHATDYAYGAISLRINGGYIKSDGEWVASSIDPQKGYNINKYEVMQEERWINFNEVEMINKDSAELTGTTNPHPAGVDDIVRKYVFTFYLPKGQELVNDLVIDFANRGWNNKDLYVDQIEMIENTILYNIDNSSLLKATNYIDNSGIRDMVSYDSIAGKIKVSKSVFEEQYGRKVFEEDWVKSSNASDTIVSSIEDATIVGKNREVHMGFGGASEDTSPQWLGYVNHTFFGKDYNEELYQDEDTVHTYDEEGTGTLSKVCLAGEFERVEAATWSAPNLTVTFTHDGYLNAGDNIVIREWMDTDNSWGGNGVWVVTSFPDADHFMCQRINTLDNDPGALPQDNLISFRPYYYYGIKDGEPNIYRISPDTLYTDADTASTDYIKGKIEKSVDISQGITSICTYYNKGTGGATPGLDEDGATKNGGGMIYALSSNSNEVYVINVVKKYDEWTTSKLAEIASIDLTFKSFKWSNDHINGNVDGTIEVFGGTATVSSPTIEYAGTLSDILETKAPNKTYVHTQTVANSDQITTNMFDTRLWIQSRPSGSSDGFSEGDRFLFAAKTEVQNTNGPDVFYCADRTPPTTVVTKTKARANSSGHKFDAGPGNRPSGDMRSYFYHYYDDDDDKHKFSRLSALKKPGESHNSHSGTIQTQIYDRPYMNFGYNVGYDNDTLPSIKVAKHSLFQLADNNGDGVIDGTGLVVPSTTSITDTGDDYDTGPYGRLHQRVCGHVVGMIGGTSSGTWWRHWGRMHGRMNLSGDDYFQMGYGDGPHEDAPEQMTVDKMVFISSDIHYGDYQPIEAYDWTNRTSVSGGNSQTDLTISHSVHDLTTLEVGDIVHLKGDNGTRTTATITLIQAGDNLVRVNLPTATISDDDGKLYPFAPHKTDYWEKGGIEDSEPMFHFSYDEDDNDNGAIFTTGEGSGHYTRTFMTPACYWGGPITDFDGSSWGTYTNPGLVWNIEKLSFRAGVMMRPFQMDDDDFNDLIVGTGIAIDMPSWPNNILHKAQNVSGNDRIHYSVDNSDTTNLFASKLFITCPITGDSELRSKAYMVDLDFMYPSQSNQVEVTQTTGGATTNTWNEGVSWDVCFAGTVNGYTTADVTDGSLKSLHTGAGNHPVVKLDVSTFTGPNNDIFSTTSYYRTVRNGLAGLCITVMDGDTGACETRYIIGSEHDGTSADTDDIYVQIHYPFSNDIDASTASKFWVWKHSLVATAPVRLFKTFELPHSIGTALSGDPIIANPIYQNTGEIDIANTTAICTTNNHHNLTSGDLIKLTELTDETHFANNSIHEVTVTSPDTFTAGLTNSTGATIEGTWSLVEDSVSSAANPIITTLNTPLLSASFGGLDMRKAKSYTVSSVANGTSAVQRLHISEDQGTATANHFLNTGDTITYDSGGGNELDGVYPVDKHDDDQLDITTTETETDTGTAYTNQWEMLIAGTASRSEMGELRAGLTQWDKGDIASNIQRYDSVLDADRFMNYGESSVIITPTSLPNQSGDYFLKNNRYYYKISYVYDGYQEGPLSNSYWSHYDTSGSRSKLAITIKVKKALLSRRLSSVCLYRKDDLNDFYKLVKDMPVESGWTDDGTYYRIVLGDEGQVGATYESRTGLSEVIETIKLKYGLSCEAAGYLFAGDCSHDEIANASNQIFRSKPGKFSIFDWANDFLVLKSKPTAMVSFNGRLYAFDETNTYTINPETLTTEDIYEGIGCLGKDSIVVTEFGMFYCDKNGAYMHTGQGPAKISDSIQQGGDTDVSFGGTDNIRDVGWNNVVTNNVNAKPYVMFDAVNGCVLFNVEYISKQTLDTANSIDLSVENQYIWSYSISRKRWDLFELAENSHIGKPFYGEKGEIFIPIDDVIFEHRGGSALKDYTWVSKKLTMGEDSIMKVFNKVKLNGITTDINLNGVYHESSDRLLIVTSDGNVSSDDIDLASAHTGNIDYRLRGSNKKGRWVQFKLENMTESLDSFGILFRRKGTK